MSTRRPPITEHDAACMCPVCLMLDMDEHLAGQGLDASAYWMDVPGEVIQSMPGVARERMLASRPGSDQPRAWTPGVPTPESGLDRVPVRVRHLFAGAWAHFTGTERGGAPLVIAGAVIAGPDEVDVAGAPMLAVLVRAYRDGVPDRVLYVAEDATAELVDDPADHPARARHAIAPVFGPVETLALMRRDPAWPKVQLWRFTEHADVTPEQVAECEQPGPEPILHSVHRGHLPIPAGLL